LDRDGEAVEVRFLGIGVCTLDEVLPTINRKRDGLFAFLMCDWFDRIALKKKHLKAKICADPKVAKMVHIFANQDKSHTQPLETDLFLDSPNPTLHIGLPIKYHQFIECVHSAAKFYLSNKSTNGRFLRRNSSDSEGSPRRNSLDNHSRSPSPSPTLTAPNGVFKVLLCEDNVVNQITTTKMLEKSGFFCEVAGNGQLAVEACSKQQYDVILMDAFMPVMDGYTATSILRERETELQIPRTPIICLTANALAGEKEKCLACGMDDYINKPCKQRDLVKMINMWIAASQQKSLPPI